MLLYSSISLVTSLKKTTISVIYFYIITVNGDLLHWINTVTLGAVIIMMLHNKYEKLYKNIHLDDQLRQRERRRDECNRDVETEKTVTVAACG